MGRKSKRKSLVSSIEKYTEPARMKVEVINENLDQQDLLEFTAAFLEDVKQLQPLDPMNLMTPEGAREAVEMLEARKRMLDQKLKAVSTLKTMLQKRSAEDSYQ